MYKGVLIENHQSHGLGSNRKAFTAW